MGDRTFNVLSLGGGVQSTTLYLMFMRGEVVPPIEAAIFADTGDEPRDVYEHLKWLQTLSGPPIFVRSKSRISDDLARGMNSTGQRFATIPVFTANSEGKRAGMVKRQCSKEYKVEVIERTIRREIVGLAPRQPLPIGTSIVQYMGISLDEQQRAERIMARTYNGRQRWSVRFPLIEKSMTRQDCVQYLADKVPHETPRSACVFCPYHSDAEWVRIKANSADWALAVAVDRKLREPGCIFNRNLQQKLYVHKSCRPLDQVEFHPEPPRERSFQLLMNWECVEGVCGV